MRSNWNINECHNNNSNDYMIDSKVAKVCLFGVSLIQKLTFEVRVGPSKGLCVLVQGSDTK